MKKIIVNKNKMKLINKNGVNDEFLLKNDLIKFSEELEKLLKKYR